ncbi:TadE/TadG family type IV pilus assembly protein [Paenibacillus gorillae]|uniref:TadE/TadG family type IV pilus assembly protein n=1 Tax=Paenibacillus gorillae TaxID=1243662 RepID=UPI0012DC6F81|nr:TadE family protein [Paenibacillus gorillae]
MKRRRRLAGLISLKSREGERGSIVVEAALVMPILLIVLLVFIVLVRLNATQMALQSAASQTVRQMAAHIYPVDLAYQQVEHKLPEFTPANANLSDWGQIAVKAAEWLPDPAGAAAAAVIQGDWLPLIDTAATELGRAAIEPMLQHYADEAVINKERIKLSRLGLPDLKHKQEPYLTIEAEYDFPMKIPFTGKKIRLREQASERVWVEDAVPASDGGNHGEADVIPVQIISIEPTPLRPGLKATVVALTRPGASVSLEVQYKSGKSTAKHLGETTADANGYVQWTWHVSGNTTPGIWELTATSASGEKASRHFSVEKKPKGG